MDSHKRLLSILHIVYGSFNILMFVIFSTLARTLMPFLFEAIDQSDPDASIIFGVAFSVIKSVFFVLVLLVPVPSLVGGWAYLNNRKWGLNLMMVSGALSLLSFPLGTGLGVYTIWTYLEVNKEERND